MCVCVCVRARARVCVCERVCVCVCGFDNTHCKLQFCYAFIGIIICVPFSHYLDECASSPCQNGGNCQDSINMYSCICPDGFTGVNCETNIGKK